MMQGREEAAEPGGGCGILARRMWGEEGHSTPRHVCGSGQSERQGGDTGGGGVPAGQACGELGLLSDPGPRIRYPQTQSIPP